MRRRMLPQAGRMKIGDDCARTHGTPSTSGNAASQRGSKSAQETRTAKIWVRFLVTFSALRTLMRRGGKGQNQFPAKFAPTSIDTPCQTMWVSYTKSIRNELRSFSTRVF